MSILLDVQRVLPLITLFSFSYCRGYLQTKPRPPSFLFSHFLIMPCKTYTGWMYFFCHPVHIVGDPVHDPELACLPCDGCLSCFRCFFHFHSCVDLIISKNISACTPDAEVAVRARIYCFASAPQVRHDGLYILPHSRLLILS